MADDCHTDTRGDEMKTLRMLVDLTYDESIMHEDTAEEQDWFFHNVLANNNGGEQLILHSNFIGDEVGEIKIIKIESVLTQSQDHQPNEQE